VIGAEGNDSPPLRHLFESDPGASTVPIRSAILTLARNLGAHQEPTHLPLQRRKIAGGYIQLATGSLRGTPNVSNASKRSIVPTSRPMRRLVINSNPPVVSQSQQLRSWHLVMRCRKRGSASILNFACVEFRPTVGKILLYLEVDPSMVTLEQGFTRNVSNVGHSGTGDLEITMNKPADLEKAKPLIQQATMRRERPPLCLCGVANC
jgi:predicted transport protein